MRKEYDLEKLKVKRKSIHPYLPKSALENPKIKVTIGLDKDIVDFFKSQAKKPGTLPYQTQVNQALRSVLPSSDTNNPFYEKLKKELISDDGFVFALKEVINKINHVDEKNGP